LQERIDLESEDLASLQARQGYKWSRDAPDKIPCWVADMDFPVAPPIVRALESAIESNDLGYPAPSLEASLASTFARWSKTRHGLYVDPGAVIVTTDVVQAIYLAVVTMSDPGDGVLVLTPAYPPYFPAMKETSRRMVTHDLSLIDGRFRFDPKALRDLVASERPRMMLLCNPHNPTGTVFTTEELREIASIADEADLVVISDEIHCDLVYPGATHVAFATLGSEIAARTITLSSTSKTFNLAGLRCAVASCGSDRIAERIRSIPERQRGSVNNLGMIAAIAAWADGIPWLEAVMAYLEGNRDRVTEFLAGFADKVRFVPPEATYLGWVDFRGAGLGDDPAAALSERGNVTLLPGPDFGPIGRGYARLNFATTKPVLDEALARIGSVLSGS
jgi:cysteine-S-conjugate beta-lyase